MIGQLINPFDWPADQLPISLGWSAPNIDQLMKSYYQLVDQQQILVIWSVQMMVSWSTPNNG